MSVYQTGFVDLSAEDQAAVIAWARDEAPLASLSNLARQYVTGNVDAERTRPMAEPQATIPLTAGSTRCTGWTMRR